MAVSRCNSVAYRRASGAEFSLLGRDDTTGNFTDVVSRIPVKIVLDTDLGLTLTIRGALTRLSLSFMPRSWRYGSGALCVLALFFAPLILRSEGLGFLWRRQASWGGSDAPRREFPAGDEREKQT